MRVSEIASRLTGISTPLGGASWEPGVSDVEVARRVLTFLEDRRVLYTPFEAEMPEHCVASVLQIREFLTDELTKGGVADELTASMRAMRASCRKFLDTVGPAPPSPQPFGGPAGWAFNQALGELRGVFGVHIGQLAVRYDVELPDHMAEMLPAPPTDDDASEPRRGWFARFRGRG